VYILTEVVNQQNSAYFCIHDSFILTKLNFITMDLFTTPVPRHIGPHSTDHTTFVSKEDIIHILSRINFTGVSYRATISDDIADTPSFLKAIFDDVVHQVTELGPAESSPKKLLDQASADTTESTAVENSGVQLISPRGIHLSSSHNLSGLEGFMVRSRILDDDALDWPEIPPEEEAAIWERIDKTKHRYMEPT
jgi:hypothetical protein